MTRAQIIKTISYAITNGRGIKIHIDGHQLRLQFCEGYLIWHDETDKNIAAIIHEEDFADEDTFSSWAKEELN